MIDDNSLRIMERNQKQKPTSSNEIDDEIDDSFSSGSNSPNHLHRQSSESTTPVNSSFSVCRHLMSSSASSSTVVATVVRSSSQPPPLSTTTATSKSSSKNVLRTSSSSATKSSGDYRSIQKKTKDLTNEKMAEMFCSMLDMFKESSDEFTSKLVLMSQSPPVCLEMRQYGYLPVLVQLLHQHSLADNNNTSSHENIGPDTESFLKSLEFRRNTAKALRNIVHNTQNDSKEDTVLQLLDDLRSFCDVLYLKCDELPVDSVDHPCSQLAEIVHISADPEFKQIIELFGGVYVITDVIKTDYKFHHDQSNESCYQLCRYSLMILTNLTLDNSRIKSQLGSMRSFMTVLVAFFGSPSDELIQWAANLIRNLAWKTDYSSKQMLRDVKSVSRLAQTALNTTKESTLKAILAALWNLTAHSTPNKADFCKVEGALEFLISTLTYNGGSLGSNLAATVGGSMATSTISNSSGLGTSTISNSSNSAAVAATTVTSSVPGTSSVTVSSSSSSSSTSCSSSTGSSIGPCHSASSMLIIESGGGILRNISSYIATNDQYRECLRQLGVIGILLDQLKSPSLAIVNNACITLSNLSARCTKDQQIMIESGTVNMMHNLTNSKHKMIQVGASATLKNLLTSPVANLSSSASSLSASASSHQLLHHSFHNGTNNNSFNNNDGSTSNLFNSKLSLASLQYRKLQDLKHEISSCISQNFDHQQMLLGDSPNSSPTHTLHPHHHQAHPNHHSGYLQSNQNQRGALNRSATLSKLSSGSPSTSSPGVPSSQSFSINMPMCGNFSGGKQQQQQLQKKSHQHDSPNLMVGSSQFHKVSRSSSHDSIGSTHSEPLPKAYRSGSSNAIRNGGGNGVGGSTAVTSHNLPKSGQIMDSQHQASYGGSPAIQSYSFSAGKNSTMLYSTLPANSRICDNSLIGSGGVGVGGSTCSTDNTLIGDMLGSDLDVCCGDIHCHPATAATTTATTSSFLATESLEIDPEPTDYSQRYKEQPVDDFTAPRRPRNVRLVGNNTSQSTSSSSLLHSQQQQQHLLSKHLSQSAHSHGHTPHHPHQQQQQQQQHQHQRQQQQSESGECEDSVKVYQTEGTPLAFSLAPSLSDLRHVDLKQQLHTNVVSGGRDSNSNYHQPDDDEEEDNVPIEHSGRTSDIEDDEDEDTLGNNNKDQNKTNSSATGSPIFKKPSPPPKPQLQPAADQPQMSKKVIPVAAKRLSKLSKAEQQFEKISSKNKMTNGGGQQSAAAGALAEEEEQEEQNYENIDQYRRDLVVGSSKIKGETKKDDEDRKRDGIESNDLNLANVGAKNNNNDSAATTTNATINDDPPSSEDDDEILQQSIQFAMPVQKKRIFKRHTSSANTTTSGGSTGQNSPHSSSFQRSMSHQLVGGTQQQQQTPPQPPHHLYDQKKRFYVEDTPVQFSECHSPLSELSFDSDDEDDQDKRMLDAAINFGMNSGNSNGNVQNYRSQHQLQNQQQLQYSQNNGSNGLATVARQQLPQSQPQSNSRPMAPISSGVVSVRNNQNLPKQSSPNNDQQQRQQQLQSVSPRSNNTASSSSSSKKHLDNQTKPKRRISGTGSSQQQQPPKPEVSLDVDDQQGDEEDDDDEEDDRTYTVCAQSSRLASASSNSGSTTVVSVSSKTLNSKSNSSPTTSTQPPPQPSRESVGKNRTIGVVGTTANTTTKMSDISTQSDIDSTKPPSALYDENLMMISSTDSFGLRQQQICQQTSQEVRSQQPKGLPPTGRKSPAGAEAGHNQDDEEDDEDGLIGDEDDELFAGQASLLENTKPPSIMDHSSLMSQSTASITSEISDIAIDQIPIRRASGSSDFAVATAASGYAKEINNLVKSMNDNGIATSSHHRHRKQHGHAGRSRCERRGHPEHSSTSSLSSSSSVSLSIDNRTKNVLSNQVTKSSDDLLTSYHYCDDPQLTFQLEPTPQRQQPPPPLQQSPKRAQQQTSRSLPRRSTSKELSTNKLTAAHPHQLPLGSGTIGGRLYSTSNTRTYNKTGGSKKLPNYYDSSSVDCLSDTDISETLPLDDTNITNITKQRHHSQGRCQQPLASPKPLPPQPPVVSNVLYKKPMGSPNFSEQFPPVHSSHSNPSKPINPHNSHNSHQHHHQFQFDHSGGGKKCSELNEESQLSPFGGPQQQQSSSNSSSLRRNHHNQHNHQRKSPSQQYNNKQAMKADFEDKDMLFTTQQLNQIQSSSHSGGSPHYFQQHNSKGSNPIIKTASKYFDRHGMFATIGGGGGGSGGGGGGNLSSSSSLLRNQRGGVINNQADEYDDDLEMEPGYSVEDNNNIRPTMSHRQQPVGGGSQANDSDSKHSTNSTLTNQSAKSPAATPAKTKTSLLSNVKSRLTASLSSHNIGSSSSSSPNSLISSSKSSSRKIEVKSKIASFWKRSKSTHDKLDTAAAPSSTTTTTPQTKGKESATTAGGDHSLNRSINSRRSFGKSGGSFDIANNNNLAGDGAAAMVSGAATISSNNSKIIRSSTYEKLPVNDEEARRMATTTTTTTNNNPGKPARSTELSTGSRQHLSQQQQQNINNNNSGTSGSKFNTFHYGSTTTTACKQTSEVKNGHSSSSSNNNNNRSWVYTPTNADKLNGNSSEFTFTTFVKPGNNHHAQMLHSNGRQIIGGLTSKQQNLQLSSSSSSSSSGSLPLSTSNSSLNLTPTQGSLTMMIAAGGANQHNQLSHAYNEHPDNNNQKNNSNALSNSSSSPSSNTTSSTTATNNRKTCLVTTV